LNIILTSLPFKRLNITKYESHKKRSLTLLDL
jgi:hypothetical protein